MVMEMIKAVSRCHGLVVFHTLLCLLGLLGAFISHFFILIQDLFAEMTGARTVPRAPSMHSIGLGLKQAFFFEGPTVKVNILG
jgi:hypothetical protein